MNTSEIVLNFAKIKIANKTPYFFSEELFRFVSAIKAVAPGTPDRILRQLKKDNMIDYTVVNRPVSFYRIDRVRAKG